MKPPRNKQPGGPEQMIPATRETKVEKFFITAKSPVSLKQLLADHLPQRYDPETVIISGGAWLNRKRVLDPSITVAGGETVKVHTSPFQGKRYVLDPEQVIFENNDLLVVYKPCDLNVHAVPSSVHYNLMYGVNIYLQQQGVNFEANPLTRLDRPVEGLVIFAKNKSSERQLFRKIKHREIKKWYMAALEKPKQGDPGKYLRIRDTITNNGARTFHDKSGKTAHSLFVKIESLDTADLYSVFIFTGRRHQIRFHAAHYIAPVVGDRFYGSSHALPPDEIALVCRGYNIPFRKETLRVRLPVPYLDLFRTKLTDTPELLL
jgi:23S rRNA pseudouridine1911/1915/1917 synthase